MLVLNGVIGLTHHEVRRSGDPEIPIIGVPNEIRTRVTAVKGRCPRPLDEGDNSIQRNFGGGKRDRTADLLHAMQALSQLSYTPTEDGGLYRRPRGL